MFGGNETAEPATRSDRQGHQTGRQGRQHEGSAEDGADPDFLVDADVAGTRKQCQQRDRRFRKRRTDRGEKRSSDSLRYSQFFAEVFQCIGK